MRQSLAMSKGPVKTNNVSHLAGGIDDGDRGVLQIAADRDRCRPRADCRNGAVDVRHENGVLIFAVNIEAEFLDGMESYCGYDEDILVCHEIAKQIGIRIVEIDAVELRFVVG